MEYKTISQEELKAKLDLHEIWTNYKEDGERLNLCGFDLSNANLNYVNLSDANLSNANLNYVNLSDANLSGIDLKGCKLYKTDLFYTKIDNMISIGNVGDESRTVYYFYKDNRVICGCFDDTLEEFEKVVREKYGKDNKSYKACIKLFKSYKWEE